MKLVLFISEKTPACAEGRQAKTMVKWQRGKMAKQQNGKSRFSGSRYMGTAKRQNGKKEVVGERSEHPQFLLPKGDYCGKRDVKRDA
jgi:hypothetical protein